MAELSFVQRHYKKLSILTLPPFSIPHLSKLPAFAEHQCKKSGLHPHTQSIESAKET